MLYVQSVEARQLRFLGIRFLCVLVGARTHRYEADSLSIGNQTVLISLFKPPCRAAAPLLVTSDVAA